MATRKALEDKKAEHEKKAREIKRQLDAVAKAENDAIMREFVKVIVNGITGSTRPSTAQMTATLPNILATASKSEYLPLFVEEVKAAASRTDDDGSADASNEVADNPSNEGRIDTFETPAYEVVSDGSNHD